MKTKPRPEPIIKEDHALIPVRNGDKWLWAMIDVEDLERVIIHNWCKGGKRFYVGCKINNKIIQLHNYILNTTDLIDHKDCDQLNFKKSNLRICSTSQNSMNKRKRKYLSSIYKGVCFDKSRNKFLAKITRDNNQKTLGRFESEEEAARTYDNEARELFGEFGRFNFPREGEQSVFI